MSDLPSRIPRKRVNSRSLEGQHFGRLTVLRRAPEQYVWRHHVRATWLCICQCGKECAAREDDLVGGRRKSCGCFPRTGRKTHSKPIPQELRPLPEVSVWKDMRARCHRASHADFKYYGGRGISVCDRWRESFEAFYADMGSRPSNKHSIDRINNDGNYEPGNCRWATRSEQERNKRAKRLAEVA